ncbi:MAG: response regulator [Chroococcidiopsidaceae cyanobacterium CP_BM_ER_R8_30]|nr:response regulator [Chroococcidiopsidaceae cyanobacterium CP_BM_ER_R8_30]
MLTKSVLLIEDEANVREIIQACLSDIGGWNVQAFSSAQAGLRHLATERPDVIVVDVLMPGMDGVAFIHQLRDNPSNRSIPVILLTVKARWFTPQELHRLGVVEAIAKPFDAATLSSRISSALGWDLSASVKDDGLKPR